MKIKTAELTGKPLDWALAVAMGLGPEVCYGAVVGVQDSTGCWHDFKGYTDPATCMGLIEKQKINVKHICHLATKRAVLASWGSLVADNGYMQEFGSTPAEAVARCVVAMRLGNEVDVPDELVGVQS